MSVLIAGVDVGGTKISVGAVDESSEVSARVKEPTPTSAIELVEQVIELVRGLPEVVAVGLGLPGQVQDNRLVTSPNLTGWDEHFDAVARIGSALGIPVHLGNDASVGLLGEWQAGAAAGETDVLGVWMGTGIGGALILGGRPYRGGSGTGGEFGHLLVQPGGALCGCGRRGCLEAYAGRRMMGRAAEIAEQSGRPSALFEIMRKKKKSAATSSVWKAALEAGDAVATELMDNAVAMMGIAVGSSLNLLDPDLVVVGGGMAEQFGADLVKRIEDEASKWTLRARPDRRFEVAALGDNSGIVGAATLARAALVAD